MTAPVAPIRVAAADPGGAATPTVEQTVKQTLRAHVCGDVVVRGHHVGRVDCRGARDGIEELERAVLRELRDRAG